MPDIRVAVIGATGRAGSKIVGELSARGHVVTAIARNAENVPAMPGVTAISADAADSAAVLVGHDAVISAVMFATIAPATLIGQVEASGVQRYLVVGGAGGLEVSPGVRLIDAPGLPEAYRAESAAGIAFLDALKVSTLDWTFLAPSASFEEGPRTGTFRLGSDRLLTDAEGRSHVSFADYAIAMVDEVEKRAHSRQRSTVGY